MSDHYQRLRRTAETFMICQFGKYIIVHLICAHLCESRVLDGIYKIAGIANLYFMLMTNYQLNHLSASDAFMYHKCLHLLEKRQLSQEMAQRCENHQIHKADFREKTLQSFGLPPLC